MLFAGGYTRDDGAGDLLAVDLSLRLFSFSKESSLLFLIVKVWLSAIWKQEVERPTGQYVHLS